MAATNASQFFESLPHENSKAFKLLEDIVEDENPLKEAEWIDFKSGYDLNAKEHWSKALSGFANSGGGILLWGIQTKTKDNYDFPDKIVLVDKAQELGGKLETWMSTMVDPPVLGTQVRSIARKDGKGFVLAFIPASNLKPHQAKAQECHGQYFIRAGHQTVPASQPLLRALFYPQFDPVLKLTPKTTGGGTASGHQVSFCLKNDGVGSLYDLYVIVDRVDDQNEHLQFEPDPTYAVREWKTDKTTSLVGKAYLHPGTIHNLGTAIMHHDAIIVVSVHGRDMQPNRWMISSAGRPGVFKAGRLDSR